MSHQNASDSEGPAPPNATGGESALVVLGGRAPQPTPDQFRTLVEQFMSAVLTASGQSPFGGAPPEEHTLRSLFDAFVADAYTRLKPKTVIRYRYDVSEFLEEYGDLPARSLTHHHIRDWLNSLEVQPGSKAIMLRSISAFLGWAAKEELIDKNPAKRVPKPKTRSRSDSVLINDDDHRKLLAGATKRFRLVLRTLHDTGCRPGEIEKMTAEAFNADAHCFVIWEHKTDRTGRPRVVFLTPELTEEFKRLTGRFPTGPLLRSRKGVVWTGRSITQAMQKLRKKTGVNAIAYGYRHSFVTDGLKNGVSGPQMAALVGHTSTAVIDRHYSHLGATGAAMLMALQKVRGAAGSGS